MFDFGLPFYILENYLVHSFGPNQDFYPESSEFKMDNLQRFYLSRLAAANKLALEGKSFDGLEICLELRLMPDLAMYTRALVCITICDLSLIEDFPDKMTFAKEGLRIARELKVREFPQR